MKKYTEILKDPRWQKKRLEIMKRDNFWCCGCGSSKKQLHVHHLRYIDNFLPWEYEDHYYLTLCRDCHDISHQEVKTSTTRKSFHIDFFVDFAEPLKTRKFCESIVFHEGMTTVTLKENLVLNRANFVNLLAFLMNLKRFIEVNGECHLGINDSEWALDYGNDIFNKIGSAEKFWCEREYMDEYGFDREEIL